MNSPNELQMTNRPECGMIMAVAEQDINLGDDIVYRRVAQLVEHRSPKPGVAGSSPVSPAILDF